MRLRVAIGLGVTLCCAPTHARDLDIALRTIKSVMDVNEPERYFEWQHETPYNSVVAIFRDDMPYYGSVFDEYAGPERTREEVVEGRTGLESLDAVVQEASQRTGLSAGLIHAVIKTESNYQQFAVSRAGAEGLMQLMPATARALGVRDTFDVRQNVLAGTRYLRQLYDRFQSVELALAAYNAGPGAVLKYEGIPPFEETQRYVQKILARLP